MSGKPGFSKPTGLHFVGYISAYYLLGTLRLAVSLVVLMFFADFCLQFVHAYKNGNSLPERVHRLTAPTQYQLEKATQVNLRYEFRYRTVDFMPLAILFFLLIAKMPVSSVYWRIQWRLKGHAPQPIPSSDETLETEVRNSTNVPAAIAASIAIKEPLAEGNGHPMGAQGMRKIHFSTPSRIAMESQPKRTVGQ